jgi:hypothetical protein
MVSNKRFNGIRLLLFIHFDAGRRHRVPRGNRPGLLLQLPQT